MYYTHPQSVARQKEEHVLTVIGEGIIVTEPNRAIVILGVISEGTNLQQTQQENAEAIENVIQAILQQNIPRSSIKTSDFRIDMKYDYKEGVQIFRGYRITNMLQVTIDSINEVGLIVDIAVDHGVNTVRNIQLTLSNPGMYYEQALQEALQNAQHKANLLGQQLGVNINPIPYNIKEITKKEGAIPRPTVLGVSTEQSVTSIEPGELEMRAVVEAVFRY